MKHISLFDFNSLSEFNFIKTNKELYYFEKPFAFDIETTSTIVNYNKFAFMYIWQLGFNNNVYFGRTWEELQDFLFKLSFELQLYSKKRLIIYVHNLSYEFQFMRKYFNITDVFAVDERKVIKMIVNECFEFKDSYILSGQSLENVAKNLVSHNIKKLKGDLDYSLIRHEKTELTDLELAYCENDILIILNYIDEQIDIYKNISAIPLTNTGRVRKYVENQCYHSDNGKHKNASKFQKYRKIINDLRIDLNSYLILKKTFQGGFTHSNPNYFSQNIENVESYDLTSSYPSVMISEFYPMSKPIKLKFDSIEELEELEKNYCFCGEFEFTNLSNKIGFEGYISESKLIEHKKVVSMNGRVWSGERLTIFLTDVDLNIIKQVYAYDNLSCRNLIFFKKNFLPKPIIKSVLDLYQNKTKLKGVEGREVDYMLSKGMLNSIYGMSVTDILHKNFIYNDTWQKGEININEKIEEYNKKINRTLYYPWGIWVTAYARKNLFTAILAAGENYIYSDTDSVKIIPNKDFNKYIEWFNNNIELKIKSCLVKYDLDLNLMKPKNINGEEKMIGIWEKEKDYIYFKTLGAKRYIYKDSDNWHLTVAGLSKKNGMEYIKNVCFNDDFKILDYFNDNLYIPSEETGKMTHTYIDDEIEFEITDYQGNTKLVNSLSGIHLEPCEFTLSISQKTLSFIENLIYGYVTNGDKYQ